MRRFAVFTEGQTEQILVRHLLLKVVDNSRLSLECLKLAASGGMVQVPWPHSAPSPEVYFLIVDCGNDGKVLSAIRDREKDLVAKGYERIIGIRDMYSKEYHERSPGVIDDAVIAEFRQKWDLTIQTMTNADKITLHVSIMEVEAWFLAMYNLFKRLHSSLSPAFIEDNLGLNLKTVDPEKEFYRPSHVVRRIMRLCGREYGKKRGECEGIASRMEPEDFGNATENGRCKGFRRFYLDIAACGT